MSKTFGNTLWLFILIVVAVVFVFVATIYHQNYLAGVGLFNLPVKAALNRKHKISRFAIFQAMNISVKLNLRETK